MIGHSIDFNRQSFQAAHDSAEILMQSRFQFSGNKRRSLFGCEDNVVDEICVGHFESVASFAGLGLFFHSPTPDSLRSPGANTLLRATRAH